MHLWQRVANASMATCRKCNYGDVSQMHLWQCAATAINGQDRTRVSIILITGKPGAEPSRACGVVEPVAWSSRAEPVAWSSLWRGRACGVVEPSRAEPMVAHVSKSPANQPLQAKRNKISKIPIADAIIFRKAILAHNFIAHSSPALQALRANRARPRLRLVNDAWRLK